MEVVIILSKEKALFSSSITEEMVGAGAWHVKSHSQREVACDFACCPALHSCVRLDSSASGHTQVLDDLGGGCVAQWLGLKLC